MSHTTPALADAERKQRDARIAHPRDRVIHFVATQHVGPHAAAEGGLERLKPAAEEFGNLLRAPSALDAMRETHFAAGSHAREP